MRNLLLASICFLLFTACGNNSEEGKATGDTGKDVPQAVQTAFQSKYANATSVEWETGKENEQTVYEVEFKQDNVERKAYFNADGSFLREKAE